MTPYQTSLSGAAGGLAAGFVAQAVVTLFGRAGLGWAAFQGPHGPPFFPTALFMGVFYGVIAAAISRRWQESLLGLLGPLLGMAVPLAILENTVRWEWGVEGPAASPADHLAWVTQNRYWLFATTGIFVAAVWGTVGALGWKLGGRWRGLAAAILGSFAAYAALSGLQALAPELVSGPWMPTGFLPQASVLLDGLFTGALLGLSISLARRHYEKASRA